MAYDLKAIEEKIDRVATGAIEVSDDGGGLEIKRLIDAMEISKLMALSKQAIPSFMRGEPGLCYAAVVRAVRWGMDPFFVAEQSYLVNNKGEEKVAFQAQLIIAVINSRAPLAGRLRARYEGEGDDRVCVVYGIPKGEKEPLEYRTPSLGSLKATRGKNDYGKLKGSPLYESDPDQQLWYFGARSFCRKYFPEVLGGVYDRDEFEPVEPKDVTPERESLAQRLKGQKRIASPRGFDAQQVAREIGDVPHVAGQDDPVNSSKLPGSEGAAPSSPTDPSPAESDGAVTIEEKAI